MSIAHPAYQLISKLFQPLCATDWFINIRAIHNCVPVQDNNGKLLHKTEVTYNENVPYTGFTERWVKSLMNHLISLNESPNKPANIYFGVNARTRAASANKVADVAGYQAFYLDCDDNKSYTREQRLLQFQFWQYYRFDPSFIIDSGNGYHVYWLLNKLLETAQGQAILRRMVALSGCCDKGNTHDVTRILRLPGFKNQKEWYAGKSPLCSIIWPNDITQELPRYRAEDFRDDFPESEHDQIQEYYRRAMLIEDGRDFDDRVRDIAEAVLRQRVEERVTAEARAINAQTGAVSGTADFAAKVATAMPSGGTAPVAPFTPTRTQAPLLDDIKFTNDKKYLKRYCEQGVDGLTYKDLERLNVKSKADVDESAMDMKVMYLLIDKGCTLEAVLEFWMRPSLQLHRADKLQKNPNYLVMTYDNALKLVRAKNEEALLGKGKQADNAQAKIFFSNGITKLLTPENKVYDIVTADFQLTNKYYDADATDAESHEYFGIRAHAMNGEQEITRNLTLPSSTFSSIAAFKKATSENGIRTLTDTTSHLQRLAYHLETTYTAVPSQEFHSKITYKKSEFLFPKFTIKKEGVFARQDTQISEQLAKRFPIYDWFDGKFLKQEAVGDFLTKNWTSLLQMHLPRLVCGVLGLIAAAAIKPIFEEQLDVDDFHLPTLSIRGASHSGKSESVKKLYSLTGVRAKTSPLSTRTTTYALERSLEVSNFLPQVIDEFKLMEDGSNRHQLEMIRSLVRRVYTGEVMMRGRSDLSLVQIKLHAPLIIVGENTVERVGDVSEYSRVIPITTDEYRTDANVAKMLAVQEVKYEHLAPHFYTFILTQQIAPLYEEFKALRREVIESLKEAFAGERLRIGHNIAAVWFGCRLWDKFVAQFSPATPSIEHTLNPRETLMEFVKNHSLENKQTLVIQETPESPKVVVANNEFFRMLQAVAEAYESRDSSTLTNGNQNPDDYFLERENEDKLYLNIVGIFRIFREYMQKQNKVCCDLNKMITCMKTAHSNNEPWLIETSKQKKFGERNVRTAVLKLSVIRKMDVWLRTNEKLVNDIRKTLPT